MVYRTPHGVVYNLYLDCLKQTHLLIGGCTGSGKSVVLNGIISTLLYDFPANKSMVLIDPKQVELYQYKGLPHCMRYADNIPDTLEVLERAINTMNHRYTDLKKSGRKQWEGGHIYIIVDEVADLVTSSPDVLKQLIKISRLGRAANMHLIIATQSPSRKVLPADLSLNFPAQLALRCRNAIESRQILNQPGAEKLPKHGTGLYYTPDTMEVRRVKIPMVEQTEINRLIEHWKGQK